MTSILLVFPLESFSGSLLRSLLKLLLGLLLGFSSGLLPVLLSRLISRLLLRVLLKLSLELSLGLLLGGVYLRIRECTSKTRGCSHRSRFKIYIILRYLLLLLT